MIISEKRNPKKNNILMGTPIPTNFDKKFVRDGNASKISMPIPRKSHARAYLSSSLFFRIMLIMIVRHSSMVIAIINCNLIFINPPPVLCSNTFN